MALKNKTIKDLITGIDTKEIQEDRFALQRMAEKIRDFIGDKYVFILFDVNYPPKIGDEIKVGELSAIFKKRKNEKSII